MPPELSSTPEEGSWTDLLPFVHGHISLTQIAILTTVAVLVLGALGFGIAVRAQRAKRRAEDIRKLESLRACVGRNDITRMSIEKGVRQARRIVVSDMRDRWSSMSAVFGTVIDPDIVMSTTDRFLDHWTDERIVDFCIKYRRPSSVMFDEARRDRMFTCAGLTFDYGKDTHYPELVGVGEDARGCFFIFTTDSALPLSRWTQSRDVLAAALDAPHMEIAEEEGCVYTLYLNDEELRRTFDTPPDLRATLETDGS